MTRMTPPRLALVGMAVAAAVLLEGRALAQQSVLASKAATLTVKAGLNVERLEYGPKGESAGFGLSASYRAESGWGIEAELWLPGYMDIRSGLRHRDVQYNLSALRLFRRAGVRPFISFGGGFLQIQTRHSGRRSTGIGLSMHAAVGVEIPVANRIALVSEVRLNGFGTVLVRPCIGVRVAF